VTSGGNPLSNVFTIKEGGCLLERTVLGLNEEEVEEDKLEAEPGDVDNVVFPSKLVKGDGVDILIENERQRDGEVEEGESLCSDGVRKNFDGVGDNERGEGDVVKRVEEENERDNGMGSSIVLSLGENSGASCLQREEHDHTSGRCQEENAATDPIDQESGEKSPEHVPDLEDTVDEELDGGVGDTNGVEDLVEVVGDETVSGPLGEECEGNDDIHAFPVSGGSEKGLPANGLSDLTIEVNGGFDFFKLISDEGVFFVAVSVVIGEGLEGLFITTLGNQPTRRFWNEPDEENLKNGGGGLEGGGETPCPRALNFERAIGRPGGNNCTGVPEGVVCRGKRSTVEWVGNLGDQHRGGGGGKGKTKTDEETSTNKHANGLGRGLEGSRNTHDGGTQENGSTTTESVSYIGRDRIRSQSTDVLDGIQQTELRTRRAMEIVLPLSEGLEAIHHRSIVSVR